MRRRAWCKTLLVFAVLLTWALSVGAEQPAAQTPATVATPPTTAPVPAVAKPVVPVVADATDAEIRKLLPGLLEAKTGVATIEKLSALRDARVLLAFKRVQDRNVYSYKDQLVFVPEFGHDATGADVAPIYDLLVPVDEAGIITGKSIATIPKSEVSSKDFSPPRPIRNAIGNALRMLGLKVNDTAIRKNAAREMGNRRVLDALGELRELAKSDPDKSVRREAAESANLIVASGTDPATKPDERTASIASLGDMGSLRSLDMLKGLLDDKNITPAQRTACGVSINQIERHKSITGWIQNAFSGLSAGSIYILLALGLAITFGLMGVINMAHGEMLMIGAITTWACFEFISPHLPPQYFDWYYVIAFPLSFLTAALVGLAIEVSIVRHLYKRPLDSLLATIGVSYILIQAVRAWKGDNLGMRGPSWAGKNWEVIQDVVLPYNRLFLICLTIFCVLSVVLIFRYTKMGLMIRATVQNREMAQALGVNTRLVDMFTFAFGAGLAGLAGYGIVLTSNPNPEMGKTYIVKTFLTVVVGGVGKLAGVVVSGLGLGFVEKILEPITIIKEPIKIFDATWAQVAALIMVVLFMQRKPGGLFPEKGRMADQADRTSSPTMGRKSRSTDIKLGAAFVFIGLVLVPVLYGTGLMSLEYVNKLGYILAFAICAIGLDLVWGYVGVLSLCQAMFFAIGGYCMGLYLINHGPMDGLENNIPHALYVVMSAVSGAKPPWFLPIFQTSFVTIIFGMLLPGIFALLIGLSTFRSRVRGVYFSILTQAITVGAWLIFQKNDLKLGGTNGLTNFTQILGFSIQPDRSAGPFMQTRFWLYIISFFMMMLILLFSKMLVDSGFGRVLVAIRDDETRLRFRGYQTWAYKTAAFTLAAMFAGIGGMLYVPQKGIITPAQMAADASILVVAWVAVGGRGSLWGAVIGAILVSLFYEWLTTWKPDYWLYALGLLFVLIPLLLRGGLVSLPGIITTTAMRRPSRARGFPVTTEAGAAAVVEGGAA